MDQNEVEALLRWIVLLLVTLNVCYLLWSLVSPQPATRSVTLWSGGVPALEILPENAMSPGVVDEGGAASAAAPLILSCWRIGPFTEPEQLAVFVESRLTGVPVAVLQEEQFIEGDWRVFLPPAESREAAAALMESLQSAAEEAGESLESFVMTGGPRENGVSLGLFRQEDNARSLASRTEALGLEVDVEREAISRPVEWVEVMAPDGWMDESRRSGLASYAAGLQVTENVCQTIAPQPYFP